MADAGDLPGRSGIVALFDRCLARDGFASSDRPLIVLLGPRGSGKTWTLKYLLGRCSRSVAVPHVLVDCATARHDSSWALTCDLADELAAIRWSGFGRMRFPRVAVARLAVEADLPDRQDAAVARMREVLREHAGLGRRAQTLGHNAADAGVWLLQLPPNAGSLISRTVQSVVMSRAAVEARYGATLTWFGTRTGSNRGGLVELVALHRRYRGQDRDEAERILVDAFLADVAQTYRRRRSRRKLNCAVLLDNCDHGFGARFLNLVAEARTTASECDPLIVVASARTLPALAGLLDRWEPPWTANRQQRVELPVPESASYEAWDERREGQHGRNIQASWWLPVRLRDLAVSELPQTVAGVHRRFVHRLTAGHPSSARKLCTLIADEEPSAASLRCVVDRLEQERRYLIADVPEQQLRLLRRWAAARYVEFAGRAFGGSEQVAMHERLQRSLWLVSGEDARRGPRLHPWLRRILLRELVDTGEWHDTHRQLSMYAEQSGWRLDAVYHRLATGDVAAAVDYLATQLDEIDAEHWIREFNELTAAPGLYSPAENPGTRHETLLRDRTDRDLSDGLRVTIWSLVAARWIWADPVGDPAFTLAGTIGDAFGQLGVQAKGGNARFSLEAASYREMRP